MSNPFSNGPQGPPDQGQPYGQPQQPQQPYGQPQQPYGQQPPQYGQPGPPGQPGPYPQPGGYSPAPPPRQGGQWKKWLRIIVPVVVIAIAAIAYFVGNKDDATKAKVGDCLTSTADVDDMKTVGCDSANAAYQVIEKFDNTNDTDKCETDEMVAKGSAGSFYWSGSGKGVLCLSVTKHTTLEQAEKLGFPSQEDLDAYRDEFASKLPNLK